MRSGNLPRKSGVVQTWPGTAASELVVWKHYNGRAGLDWLVKWGRTDKLIESPLRLSSGSVPSALEVTWCVGGLDGEGPHDKAFVQPLWKGKPGFECSPRTKPKERTKRKRTKERNKRSLCVSCGLPETPKEKSFVKLVQFAVSWVGSCKRWCW